MADPTQIYIDSSSIKITGPGGKNLTTGKTCQPGQRINFRVNAVNKSGKPFQYNYQMKVNGRSVSAVTAKWKANEENKEISFDRTFNNEGLYYMQIGSYGFSFTCGGTDPVPANGALLKQGAQGGTGQFRFVNQVSSPIIVTLTNANNPSISSSMLVKASSTATMTGITSGTYSIKVKSGTLYSDSAKDFLRQSFSYAEPKRITYPSSKSYSVWTYTFRRVYRKN